MDGGTTEEATEIEENAVVLGNTDRFTFVAAIPFNAAVAGAYGAHVVRHRHSLRDGRWSPVGLRTMYSSGNDPSGLTTAENIFGDRRVNDAAAAGRRCEITLNDIEAGNAHGVG